MKRHVSENILTAWVDSPLLHRDLLVEVASHLDKVSLVLLCFTTRLAQEAVWALCKARKRRLLSKDDVCECSSPRGYLSALVWFFDNECGMCNFNCMMAATAHGHLETLQWLYTLDEVSHSIEEALLHRAASSGQLAIVEWLLITRGVSGDSFHIVSAAAEGGHLEIVKLLHLEGFPWDASTCEAAAMGGHLHILKWAREQGCPWDSLTVLRAAAHGHLDLLKWALDNDCPSNPGMCRTAVRYGQAEVLKWARENGYAYDEHYLMDHAIIFDQPEMVRWIQENPM